MASSFVAGGPHEESSKKLQNISPKNIKRTWSSSGSPTYSHSGHQGAPMCVCAPATHAGSFKCRLHRVNSQVSSHQSDTALPQQPAGSAAAVSKTVEAQ